MVQVAARRWRPMPVQLETPGHSSHGRRSLTTDAHQNWKKECIEKEKEKKRLEELGIEPRTCRQRYHRWGKNILNTKHWMRWTALPLSYSPVHCRIGENS